MTPETDSTPHPPSDQRSDEREAAMLAKKRQMLARRRAQLIGYDTEESA